MQGPGQSLRQAREAHGRTIEEMAEATKIRLPFLAALEQEAFDSLPGRGFGKLYIRAYAEVLGFDPRPVIEAYDRAIRETDAAAPADEASGAPRPGSAVLAQWRAELIAKRGEADASGEPGEVTSEDPADDRHDPGPGRIEAAAGATPLPIGSAVEPIVIVEVPELPAATLPLLRTGRSRLWLVVAVLSLGLLSFVAYRILSGSTPRSSPAAARQEAASGKASAPAASPPRPAPAVEAPRTALRTPSPGGAQPAPSSLEVAESGVGLRFDGSRLQGEGNRFVAGQRVTFATRVLGGAGGESIRHVWLRDGKVEQSIPLRLGGASWRTYSTKTLGRPGAWAVEARDEKGRVIARADFTVAP